MNSRRLARAVTVSRDSHREQATARAVEAHHLKAVRVVPVHDVNDHGNAGGDTVATLESAVMGAVG